MTTDRRNTDTDVALLDHRVVSVEAEVSTIGQQLTKHVMECAAMQKKFLLVVVFLSGWVVSHSPEGMRIIGKVIGAVLP